MDRQARTDRTEKQESFGEMICGRNPVLEALAGDVTLEKIWIQQGIEGTGKKIFALAKKRGIPLQGVDKSVLDRMMREQGAGGVGRHQGVIAFTAAVSYSSTEGILGAAEDLGAPAFVLVLDGIEDPHNLGAILRSAEGAGVHGVIIPRRRASSVNETVVRVSAGAALHVPVARVANIPAALEELKERGLWVYGLDMEGENYGEMDFSGAIALVVGAEGKGLSRLVKEKCDYTVSIPMKGKVGSLNASNAAAVVLFQISGKR